MLFKKPNEEFDKIITTVEIGNFQRAVKGKADFVPIGGEGYHIIINKDSDKEILDYNITIAIKTSEEFTEYKDIFGNLLITKLNANGEIIDLEDEELFNLLTEFLFEKN